MSAVPLDLEDLVIAHGSDALEDAATKILCERSLKRFVQEFWGIIEPGTKLVDGWIIDAVCLHLEAITYGHIRRLLINVPPGTGKSVLLDVFWPAWEWGPKNMPTMRYIAASYSERLTIRDNQRFRRIISSDKYQRIWGDRVQPSEEQFSVINVANRQTGWKVATSVGGVATGARGTRFLIDDANNMLETESDVIRENTNMWLREVVPDRLNNLATDAIVNIQQRTHELDASGCWLEQEISGLVHLMIPMEFDETRRCETVLEWKKNGTPKKTWTDPRTYDGELAWPARFPQWVVDGLKKEKQEYAYAGQYQQAPVPRGGGIIKRSWWGVWPDEDRLSSWEREGKKIELPPFDYVLAGLDGAWTKNEEADYTALTVWGVWSVDEQKRIPPRLVTDTAGALRMEESDRRKIMLLHAWQKRLTLHGPPEERPTGLTDQEWNGIEWKKVRQEKWGIVEWVSWTCNFYNVDTLVIENKASGSMVADELARLFHDMKFGVELQNIKGDKQARMLRVSHLFSNGMIHAPLLYDAKEKRWDHPAWCADAIQQITTFPKGRHDDIPDSTSLALQWLREHNLAERKDEQQETFDEGLRYRRRPVGLASHYQR